MSKVRWSAEGDDAAALAQAILNGTVTESPKSFRDFFGRGGPGQAIGEKFNCNDPKGERNLRINTLKLCRKIQVWKSNRPDPETGKHPTSSPAAIFSQKFLTKARFPARPESLSDLPQDQIADFVAGRDDLFEKAVLKEREEAKEEAKEEALEIEDDDSLTVTGENFDVSSTENEQEQEQQEHEDEEESEDDVEEIMPVAQTKSRVRLPLLKEPFRQNNQCPISWEVLDPKIGTTTVRDPAMARRNASLCRVGLILRVDIPGGVVPSSFVPEVSSDGKTITFTCHKDQSRHDASYCLGVRLRQEENILHGMESSAVKSWSFVKKACEKTTPGAEVRECGRCTVILPEACEQEFRDPLNHWEVNEIGVKGCSARCSIARSMFHHLFLFTVRSREATPARASMNRLMCMDENEEDDLMSATNLARANYHNQRNINNRSRKQPAKKPKVRPKNEQNCALDNLSEQVDDVSISNATIASNQSRNLDLAPRATGGRRNRSALVSVDGRHETESQHRTRLRGKLSKIETMLATDEQRLKERQQDPPVDSLFVPVVPPLPDEDDAEELHSTPGSEDHELRSEDNEYDVVDYTAF